MAPLQINCQVDVVDDGGSVQSFPEPATAWSPRSWLKFLAPRKSRDPSSKGRHHAGEDDEGAGTENETDSDQSDGSQDSPFREKSLFEEDEANFDLLDPCLGEDMAGAMGKSYRFFGFANLPDLQNNEDEVVDRFFRHRDDVCLLKDNTCSYSSQPVENETGFTRLVGHLMKKRKSSDDDSVSLLSEHDGAHDRLLPFDLESLDSTNILEDLSLFELKKQANEGAAAFDPDQGSSLFPFNKEQLSPAEALLFYPEGPPMWSDELRKRLDLQKAYQMKLSYGGRNFKSSLRGKGLPTVFETTSEEFRTRSNERHKLGHC